MCALCSANKVDNGKEFYAKAPNVGKGTIIGVNHRTNSHRGRKIATNLEKVLYLIEYLAKWTSSDRGSTVFGGWHKAAKDYFIEWAEYVRDARAHERCAPVEERGMLDLRAKMGITAGTEEEYLRSKKRKSTQTARSQEEDIEFFEEV